MLSTAPISYTPTRANFGKLEVDLVNAPLVSGSAKLFARPLDLKVAPNAVGLKPVIRPSRPTGVITIPPGTQPGVWLGGGGGVPPPESGTTQRESPWGTPGGEATDTPFAGRSPGSKVAIDTLLNNAASKLDATDSRLRSNSRFRLGKVSLKLKVLPSEDGGSVVLPDAETIATLGGNNLSELNLDLNPPPSGRGQSAGVEKLPKLLGYTRALAERKLAALGLRADYLEEQVGKAEQAGRILRQNPAAGTEAASGEIVELTIGVAPPAPGETPR